MLQLTQNADFLTAGHVDIAPGSLLDDKVDGQSLRYKPIAETRRFEVAIDDINTESLLLTIRNPPPISLRLQQESTTHNYFLTKSLAKPFIMKAQVAVALVAGLLAHATTAQSTMSLGELTFGTPQCGDGGLDGINAADCTTAVSQLLAAHCSAGVCSLPAATGGAQESAVSELVGKCEVIIGAFASGKAVTFNQDSVQSAFPGFISTCVATSGGVGDPRLLATDGIVQLVFSNGIQGGGG
jgi:hypothetical protein